MIFFILIFLPVISHRYVGFDLITCYFVVPVKNAHKKSVEPFAFIGVYEVFDYLPNPITTYKPTPNSGSAVAFSGFGF